MASIDVVTALEQARRPVLWASGGKDSLALLHLCRPWRHRLVVLHNVVDGTWPGLKSNLESCLDAWGFVRSVYTTPTLTMEAYVHRYGWPVDLVPTALDGFLPTPYREPDTVKMASWWHCTFTRRVLPLLAATLTLQADCVLAGARATDMPAVAQGGMRLEHPAVPWVRWNPLQHWTSEEVYAYIDEMKIPLPPHYAVKRTHSTYQWPECLSCTWQPRHWQTLRDHYPEEYAARWPEVAPVFTALRQSLETASASLKEIPHGDR